MKQRAICTLALVFVFISGADARFPRGTSGFAPIANNGGVVLNLANGIYFGGYNPFLNWWKISSQFFLVSSINGTLSGQAVWDNGTYLTADGELKSPMPADVTSIERAFFDANETYTALQYAGTGFAGFSGQQFDVTWTGCASPTISVGGSLGTGGSLSTGSNSATVTLGSTGFSNVTLKFTFTGIPACYSSPPRDVKIVQHQYAAEVAACVTDTRRCFNPDWISAIKPTVPFAYLRLMDWMQTNFGGISESSQLADFNYSTYTGEFSFAAGGGSVSGSVLNLSSVDTSRTPFAAGQRITCIGCPFGLAITSQATGTPGGVGTYNLSGSATSAGVDTILGVPVAGANSSIGPKGGVGPAIACALAGATLSNIEYPIPIAASDQFVTDVATALKACMPLGLKVKYSYGNENWNFGFLTYRYSLAQPTANWPGYRAARIMEIVAGVYGTTSYDVVTNSPSNSKWTGAIGAQFAGPSVATSYITGAMAYITGAPSAYTLKQLFSLVDVAPYWGNFYDGVCISNISAASQPTVTINSGCVNPTLANGQVVRLFVNGGTMAAQLNNIDATVGSYNGSSFTISSFNGSNVNTTGLSYGGANNGAMDSTIFRLADRSAALNISTPATYPTQFSYFNQQYSKAILNGSATDASYGTLTIPDGLNLTSAALGSVDLFQQNALIVQSNGLQLGQYEGGPTSTLSGNGINIKPLQAVNYLNAWSYDAGVTGDAINRSANVYATMYSQFNGVNGVYPSQFNDAVGFSPFGPWGALRFFSAAPGDTLNPKWNAITTQNALGPWANPIQPAAWAATFPSAGTNRKFDNSFCAANCTDALSGAVIGTAATTVKVLISITVGSVVSVTCDGQAGTLDKSSNIAGRTAAIYNVAVGAGPNARTCSVVSSGSSFQFRTFYVTTVSGLLSTAPKSTTDFGGTGTINYAGRDLLLTVSACNGAYANTSGVAPLSTAATTTTTFSDIDTVDGTAQMAAFNSSFSAAKFSVAAGCNDTGVAATYR